MDQQEQNRFDSIFETMSTPGWKVIIAEFQEAHDLQNNLLAISNKDDFLRAQGRLLTLQQFINLEEQVKAGYDNLVEEESSDTGVNLADEDFENEAPVGL